MSGAEGFHSAQLKELYQEVIMEHSRRPRQKGKLAGCRLCKEGKNPLCGDMITLYASLEDGNSGPNHPRLNLHFDGSGCSISQASASIMCESVQGLTVLEARAKVAQAESIYTGQAQLSDDGELAEDVDALFGVSKFPVRVKCAALPWKTLEIMLGESFDNLGAWKQADAIGACENLKPCPTTRKLRVVSTED